MSLHLDLLIPTQRTVRNSRQIETMVAFVERGGVFDRASLDEYADEFGLRPGPLVQIEQFEDESLYPRDGHHRLIGILLGGRDCLLPSEYQIVRRTYSQYTEINLAAGWVTPFDPRTELRKEDLSDWKTRIAQLRQIGSEPEVISFIRANKASYSEPRGGIRHIRDIARHLFNEEGCDQQVLRRIRAFP